VSNEKSESKETFPPKEISLPDESWRTDPVQEKIAMAIDSPALPPLWLSGNKIHDIAFCVDFLLRFELRCINGTFFDMNGVVSDSKIENDIYEILKPFISSGITNKIKQLIATLRLEAYGTFPEIDINKIHLANGTLNTDGTFTTEKFYCTNRLNVDYNSSAATPNKFLSYINDLFIDEDIPTIQEWLGYLLIPCTKAQKMLMLIGNGGEGKSRLGILLKSIFGTGLSTGNLQSLETNRFARATLENAYVFIDDDMKMEALPQTNMLKTIVTAESEVEIERKNIQSYQTKIFTRIMAFGNGTLSSLYDKSDAFYRRQIIITTKLKPESRIDDPFLTEKMIAEREGIFLWAYEGLQRLVENNFRFTISERAKQNLIQSMEDNCNIITFLKASDWIDFIPNAFISTKDLYAHYVWWCEENCEKPMIQRTFSSFINQNLEKYHLRIDTNGQSSLGRRARGYRGISKHE